MKRILKITALLAVVAVACGCPKDIRAQVPVTLSPIARQQFFAANGTPLASGCLFTYNSGTSTPAATYTDQTGNFVASNPILLDGGGFASIWLAAQSYRFVLFSTGGVNCATGTQQWLIDGINPAPFLGGANAWTGAQSFAGTSTFNGAVNLNAGGTFTGSITGAPTFTGALTFSGNPAFTGSPSFVGATPLWMTAAQANLNPEIQSIVIANNAGGTIVNSLAKLTGAPSTAVTPLVTDTVGALGIVTAGAGNTGSATIQNVGLVNCNFDAATTAGDYVVFSATVAGDCHDVPGGGFPSSGQALGRVLSTNGAAGLYQMNLFGAEDRSTAATMTFPNVVFSTALAPTNASITAQTMTTVGASNATYRYSWYFDITTIGTSCTGATTINPQLTFQDPNGASAITVTVAASNTQTVATANGTAGGPFANGGLITQVFSTVFRAKTGTVIQYSVPYTAGTGCSPAPTIQFFPVLEQLTAN